MADPGRPDFLDRPAARAVAALVLILCVGLLAYLHRDDLRRMTGAGSGADDAAQSSDPAAACIEQRVADIDAMVDEGVVDAGQAAVFKERAEAMCRATEGASGAPPSLPAE